MKLTVEVDGEKSYEINCGAGKQQIYWIGMEAAKRYGKEHYPRGVYLPDLVFMKGKDNQKVIPHPRLRICDEIPDGSCIYVVLKNRSKTQSKEERWWSDRAFGYLRNMSEVQVQYRPSFDALRRNKVRIFLELRIEVFEELRHEFPEDKCPLVQEFELLNTAEEGEENLFEAKLELPWGEVKVHELSGIPPGGDKTKIDAKEFSEVKMTFLPKPISAKEQLELDLLDKKEHLKKEKEYRLQQKLLEEQKAKQVAEKEAQRRRLQEIGHRLEVLWNSIDSKFLSPPADMSDELPEEEREREASECLAICTTFFEDLLEMFEFYAATHSQVFKKRDNLLITLQGFLHFLKAGRLAKSKEELGLLLSHMESAVPTPIADSLNVANGINFAQFLEAVMRVAYARHLENGAGIAKNLQHALQDATMEIRNRRREDELFNDLIGLKYSRIFRENYDFLAGLFAKHATLKSESDHVLDQAELEQILKDSRVLKLSPPNADPKSKAFQGKDFTKEKLRELFAGIPKIEKNKLYFPDFLELLLKSAALMNLKPDEELSITSLPLRLQHLIGTLEKKFVDVKKRFLEQCEKNNDLNAYNPMSVVPDHQDELGTEVLTEEDDDSDVGAAY